MTKTILPANVPESDHAREAEADAREFEEACSRKTGEVASGKPLLAEAFEDCARELRKRWGRHYVSRLEDPKRIVAAMAQRDAISIEDAAFKIVGVAIDHQKSECVDAIMAAAWELRQESK